VAVAADAAVKKKRFDVGPVSDTATTAVEAPAVAPPETPKSNFLSVISAAQKTLREKLTAAISAMKSGEWGAIWKFLAICLIYGMLHALGPGHGKSIVVGYFIARRGRWRQGVALGAGITVTHTLSAVLLLFILYAIFKATVFPAFESGRMGIEKASYILIMLTGLLLVAIAVHDFWKQRKNASSAESPEALPRTAHWREIIGVAAITGIVPCPAVALIVLFCLFNSMVALALLGAFVICIGMTITNVAFGIAAVAFRKGIDYGGKRSRFASIIYNGVTLAGGLLIFTSGLLLFGNLFAGRM
jgi:ABC-type nickel/cobalt efflux system permease component RcnA